MGDAMKIQLINIQEDLDRLSDQIFNLQNKEREIQEHRLPSIILELQGILTYCRDVWANYLAVRGEKPETIYPKDILKGEGE